MRWIFWRSKRLVLTAAAALLTVPVQAQFFAAGAAPALVMDVASGEVLYQDQASRPWYPASLTKLMTVYVALSAVRDHKIALDTPLVVSPRAAAMPPSKMGFVPGTQVTLDNALKMLMVRSANDLAITVAEGVSGSVEAFTEDMNQAAAQLGLHESHFVNPNGLPDAAHVSSARDMALIARALYLNFPEQASLFNLGTLGLGTEIIPNHNNMLGRYPGADGMKTGFTCSAGFNLVVSAFRGGRRLVAVVLGAPTVASRTAKATVLLDRGFAGIDRPVASIVALPNAPETAPPDLRGQVCRRGPRAALIAQYKADVDRLAVPLLPPPTPGAPPPQLFALAISQMPQAAFDPVPVHVGPEPGYSGPVAQSRPPHSPVGTVPSPEEAIAYASVPLAPLALASPLRPDATALPLRGRRLARHAPRKPNLQKAAGKTSPVKGLAAKPAPAKVAAKKPPAAKVKALAKRKVTASADPKPRNAQK